MTYYRLGKNTSSLGILYLISLSADTFHASAVHAAMTTPMTSVFDFQL
jgi:hypothetical protein